MKSISLSRAKKNAEAEMGRPIRALGFEHREVGPYTINILYFSCEYEEIGIQYRYDVYVNGKRNSGLTIR